MNCREAVRRLASGVAPDRDPELLEHLAGCPACRELAGSLASPAVPDPARIAAIQQQIGRSLTPVRPLPSPARQTTCLAAVYGAIAVATAALIGFSALRVLRPWQMIFYFGAFAAAAGCVARVVVQDFYPGIRSRFRGVSVLWATGISLSVLVLFVFPNFNVSHFASGVRCLETGCLVAVPAGIAFAFLLRRTFASNPVAASAAVGFFAGLCGTGTLALHCPVLTLPHILVWHLTVLAISAASGAGVGSLAQTFPLKFESQARETEGKSR